MRVNNSLKLAFLLAGLVSPLAAQTPDAAPQIVIPAAITPQDPAAVSDAVPGASPHIFLVSDPKQADVMPTAQVAQPAEPSPLIQLLPTSGTASTPEVEVATPAEISVVEPPPKPSSWLMPILPAPGAAMAGVRIGAGMSQPGILRLSGETAEVEMLVTLPEGVPLSLPLVLSLRSSVNNLPEDSEIAVAVNGVKAGFIALDSIGPFSERKLIVAGLVPGVNRIHLAARQSHRIFCGPEASFGVWTEIDLGRSGVPVTPSLLPLVPSGLVAALQAQSAGDRPLEILADESTDPRLIQDVARQVSDAIGFAPRLKILPFYSQETDPNAMARIAIVAATEVKASIRRGAGDAAVLQIEHVGPELPDLAAVLPVPKAEPDILPLQPGLKTALAKLGAPQIIGNTHYFRRDVKFILPDDWLLLASQKAELELHYGFSAGMAKGGLLLIKVNGQTVRLLPLDHDGGKLQPPLPVRFGASRLQAGINTVTFEMSVPGDPADLPCIARTTDMLVILGSSSLTVPPTPKMHQSDLLRSLAFLDGNDVSVPAKVADPEKDRETLLDFAALFRPLIPPASSATDRPALHVVGLDGAGLIPIWNTGLTRRALQVAFDTRLVSDPDQQFVMKKDDGVFKLIGDQDQAPASTAPGSGTGVSLLGHFFGLFSNGGWIMQGAEALHKTAFPGSVSLTEWMDGKTARMLLLQLDPSRPEDVWLLTAPDIEAAEVVQKLDSFRRDGNRTAPAQAAMLRRDGTWETWSQDRPPRLLERLTFDNLRDVLGNYASWSPLLFTALSLLFALISVIPALLFVLLTRRKGSRT
ncbi:cellulose biosynthesis cyclic di-GMP-binding regulatory protein BcsB [Pseudorhodobacter sp.]|uniref:cellulose biosynthesis cyclic di-GMP-binding regulatory protein BcsB n=1 Tax=Pseudorhodobacter sp. TaxID=1934400 RepID=UPI00264A1D6B|nr:cellulose biosynthesis cyclic di-GMP-binding regulatory protein BcsB [Pseudorhodobacter sp.]MDN5788641.1 cellulose biosynthesis cyclic di-GMP-binding regulatory protein BcsB [Pseudorhodobacter sp.]